MFGINGSELVILIVLALVLLGPERLPQYAQTLARWTRQARGMAEDAKKQFKEETGTDFDSVDWQKYDPRQYDPRRIIREALAEDYDEARKAVDSVKEAASLESPLKKPRSSSGGRAARSGSPRSGQSRAASARSAGAAGAAKRSSNASDPRSVFGSSQNGRKATGALAAGMAGSATSGAAPSPRAAAGSEEPTETEAAVPAPFDIDAT